MSIHDEFEQSLTGGRSRMKPLTKVLLGLGLLFVFGVSAVTVAGVVVARQVKSTFQDFEDAPAVAVAERIVRRSSDVEWVSSNREEGTLTVRTRGDGALRTLDASQILEGALTIHTDDGTVSLNLEGGEDGGTLVIRNADGEVVRIDARGGDGEARLTVQTDEGEVLRIDARGEDERGSLVIRTQDDVLQFDLEGGDEEGTLSIRSSGDELVRFDLEGRGDEAILRVHTESGTSTFRGMHEGGEVPSWLPEGPGRLRDVRVFSAEGNDGDGGATTFAVSRAVGDVVDHYRETLEEAGFSVRQQNLSIADRNVQATLVAENAGRSVLLFIAGTGERSTVFLAFAERG